MTMMMMMIYFMERWQLNGAYSLHPAKTDEPVSRKRTQCQSFTTFRSIVATEDFPGPETPLDIPDCTAEEMCREDVAPDHTGPDYSVPLSDAVVSGRPSLHLLLSPLPYLHPHRSRNITTQASAIPSGIATSVPDDNPTVSTSPAMSPTAPAATPPSAQTTSSTVPMKRKHFIAREIIPKPDQTPFYKAKLKDLIDVIHNLDGHVCPEIGTTYQRFLECRVK